MAKREVKKERGVFEHPQGSGVWWIHYYVKGKRHREKVGRRGDAIDLYKVRKADALRDRKLPELRPGADITLADLMADATEYARFRLATHTDYTAKERILTEPFGARVAEEITPQEFDQWLNKHCKTAATFNRYKAYLSLCYRLGMENLKVSVNPARLIRPHQEDNARTRFLTHAEFAKLLEIVRRDHPEQAPSLIVATYSAMRWSEQFGIVWGQVDFERMKIVGVKTKSARRSKVRRRDVPLNSVSAAAFKEQQVFDGKHTGPKDIVFPRTGPYADWDWWLKPALAEAKIEDVVWHSLRHACLSWAAMSGATMKEIQELGGHLTISQAARYMHLSPTHTSNASERMAQWKPDSH
jgi:integrase